MKKQTLFKILLGILAVIMVLAFAACKPKTPEDDPEDKPAVDSPDAFKFSKVETMMKEAEYLVDSFFAVDKELHADLVLTLNAGAKTYDIYVAANIVVDDKTKTDARIVLAETGVVKADIYYDGKNDDLYIYEKLSKSTGNYAMFTDLDKVKIYELLWKIPTELNKLTTGESMEKFDYAKLKADIKGGFGLGPIIEGVVNQLKVVEIITTASSYTVKINPKEINTLLETPAISELVSSMLAGKEEILDTIAEIVLGSANGMDGLKDVVNFPEISIVIGKASDKVNSIGLKYVGDLLKTGKSNQAYGLTIKVNSFSAATAVTANGTLGNSNGSNIRQTCAEYVSVVKLTADIKIPEKGIDLTIEALANPDFKTDPTALLRVYDNKISGTDKLLANVNAIYDGEYLYFDLAGAFQKLDPNFNLTTVNTKYKIAYTFFPPAPASAANADPVEEEHPDKIVLTSDLITVIIGKVGTIMGILGGIVETESINLSIDTVLSLVDGLLYDSIWDDAEGKYVDTKITTNGWIKKIEDLLAPLSNLTEGTNAVKAQDVIKTFTGLDVSVSTLVKSSGASAANLLIEILDDALGFGISVKYNASPVASIKFQLSTILLEDYEDYLAAAETDKAKYTDTNTIDLQSVEGEVEPGIPHNVYYEDEDGEEVKKFVILDTLEKLLDLYKAYPVAP